MCRNERFLLCSGASEAPAGYLPFTERQYRFDVIYDLVRDLSITEVLAGFLEAFLLHRVPPGSAPLEEEPARDSEENCQIRIIGV